MFYSRYGDGEFGLITKSNNPDFQQPDAVLAKRLSLICTSGDPKILVCIPHNFRTTRDCNEFARKFWEWWIWENNNLESVAKILKLNPWKARKFGDAQITRPYMDWKDKRRCAQRFAALKSLWQERDVLIIEGSNTKIGVGNDLLTNAKSVQRIIAPPKNAFCVYEDIFTAAKQYGSNKLVLIALGPTATVLAYDLATVGIEALDIGHIDIEYEWFLAGADKKVCVPGKATQEAHGTSVENYVEDRSYLSQIVAYIK